MRIQKVGVLSLGKIFGVLHGGMGLVVGAIFSAFALVGGIASQMSGDAAVGGFVAIMMGAGAIVALPLIYGAMGFVGGLLTALLYNVAARFAGGLEIELEQSPKPPVIPRPTEASPPPSVS